MPQHDTLTARREALVEVTVTGQARTISHAAQLAGMSREAASRAFQNAAVKQAVRDRKAARADKAYPIMRKALSRLAGTLESEDNPQTLTGIAVGMSRIVESGVDQETVQSVSHDDHQQLASRLLSCYLAGVRHALAGTVHPKALAACGRPLDMVVRADSGLHNSATQASESPQVVAPIELDLD